MLIVFVVCLKSDYTVYTQSLTVYSARTVQFPIIEANFSARDKERKQISTLVPSDVSVLEKGIQRKVIRITCPSKNTPSSFSSVLVMDISGSMLGGIPQTNMELAKTAGYSWVKNLPNDGSECAITSFDGDSYINQDFTSDKNKLTDAINKLSPSGSTNYNAAFVDGLGAGLNVVERAKNNRVIVFLTDGQGVADESSIITLANQKNTKVFCVGVRLSIPKELKNIAEKTGGLWFENVTSPEDIIKVYGEIMRSSADLAPCVIEWETVSECEKEREAIVSVPTLGVTDTVRYTLLPKDMFGVSMNATLAKFDGVTPGMSDTREIQVTSNSDGVIIDDVTSSNSDFTIIPSDPYPWKMAKGMVKYFTVRFLPTDSLLVFSRIKLQGNMCASSIVFASGGFSGKRKKDLKLIVEKPNGKEVLFTGDTTTLLWSGILPTDTVILEYSIDKGKNWLLIKDKISGYSYKWTVPNTPSTQCLFRARLLAPTKTDSIIFLEGHNGTVNEAIFSPDGTRVATVSEDKTLRIWDSEGGNEITNFIPLVFNKPSNGQTVTWSPDGSKIAVAGDFGAGLYNGSDYTKIYDFPYQNTPNITTGLFTPDGKYYLVTGAQPNLIIWSVDDPTILGTCPLPHTSGINRLTTKNYLHVNGFIDIELLSASGDRTAKLIDLKIAESPTFLGISTVLNNTFPLFQTEDNKVSHICHPNDPELRLAAANNGVILRYPDSKRFDLSKGNINDIEYSPDGKHVAVAFNSGELAVLNSSTLVVERLLDRNIASAFSVRWDPFGSRIVASYSNDLALIWDVAKAILQQDVSDTTWSIVAPAISSTKDVFLGTLPVLKGRDSVVKAIICSQNLKSNSLQLDSAQIINDSENNFSVVSGVPAKFGRAEPSCLSIELNFTPKSVGLKTATLRLFLNNNIYDVSLSGIGIDIQLQYIDKVIDFGKVPVGKNKDSLVKSVIVNLDNKIANVTHTRIVLPDIKQFFVVGGDTNIMLTKSQSQNLLLRFAPKDVGRTSTRLRIDFVREGSQPTPGSPIYIQLYGEGICGFVDSTIPIITSFGKNTMSVLTGRRITLPLVIKKHSNVNTAELPTNFSGKISFNASLLFPREEPRGTVSNGVRTIPFSGVRNPESDTLTTFSMLTLFGDSERTEINVDTLYFTDGCPAYVRPEIMSIEFTDICEAGGAKRLLQTAKATSVHVKPNIVNSDDVNLQFSCSERTDVQIVVVNSLGKTVKEKILNDLQAGLYEIPMDLSSESSGFFNVIVRTRSETVHTSFIKP